MGETETGRNFNMIFKQQNHPINTILSPPAPPLPLLSSTPPQKADISTLTTHGDPEEYALIVKIQQSLQSTLDLVAEHFPRYESAVQSYISSASSSPQQQPHGRQEPPPTRKQLQDAHMLLSETLMKSLLVFDGVVCKQDFEVARATRREAVKETQKFLDSVDDMNARVKECDRQLKLQQQQQQQR